jgi:UDP-glucose:tetrahydrobiopterin glucosyltransferase
VELTLNNIAIALAQRGHHIDVVSPDGSEMVGAVKLDQINLIQIPGQWQVMAQSQSRETLITLPENSVLGNMWDYVRQVAAQYDLVLNFAYDWLPLYLTPFLHRPVAHLISMGSLSDAMDSAIAQTLDRFPGTIGVHSHAQADTFAFGDRCRVLANGFDLSLYQFQAEPDHCLGWVGRIAPEKGLEDAIAASQAVKIPLRIWGAILDNDYWNRVTENCDAVDVQYQGFLDTQALQAGLGRCRALLATPKWVEAFGNVAVEALACGVPIIAYRRGGLGEIVQPGQSGFLVEPDSVAALVQAIGKINQIDRADCRRRAEAEYSLEAMGDRVELWLREMLRRVSFGDEFGDE